MPSVDNRIVRIEFDNSGFEGKIKQTLDSLAQLDEALQFENADAGFAGISAGINNINLSGMASAIENISSKFSALGAIGFSVIQTLTHSVLGMVRDVGAAFLGPVFSGGLTRALNIEQAQFMFRGLGMDVEAAMEASKAAVLGTAYGLDEAAKLAAQFGATGMSVGEDMTGALRGVAGAAAMTGSSFEEIGYIFSGIAGQGKVNTMDLMQFATRGLNAAAAVGKAMGITEQAVRDMVTNGELDFATFAKAMDTAFGLHAQKANETFAGSLANVKAAMSRLGAAFIAPQLTNFRDIFNAMTPVVDKLTAALKPLIATFTQITQFVTANIVKALSTINFDNLTKAVPFLQTGLMNIFNTLRNLFNIGKQAFAQIFPPGTESIIVKIAQAFATFSEHLRVSADGASRIRTIFGGFFAALSIGWTIIKEGIKFIMEIGKALGGMIGPGILDGIVKIADGFKKLHDNLVKGGGIADFFARLTTKIQPAIDALVKVKEHIVSFFSGFDTGASEVVETSFGRLKDRLQSIMDINWDPFISTLEKIFDVLKTIGQAIGDWFSELFDKIAAGMKEGDFNTVLDALNVGLLGGILAILANFLKEGNVIVDLSGGMIGKIKGMFQELTDTLQAMQLKIKSEALMNIAKAIALLTASVLILSMIDSEALTKALTAMAVGFGQLLGAFAVIQKLNLSPMAAINFALIAAGLILLAGAMVVLSVAVKILSTMDWDELVKGLGGTTILLGALVIASKPLSANSKGMIAAGIGITAMAIGLVIMAGAMKIMATMSWEELAKGLVGVAGGLAAVVGAMTLMPNQLAMVKAGISIMIVATALTILGGAVVIFASMNWESLTKGLFGLVIGLGAIVIALNLMPKNMAGTAAGILAVAGAILIIAVSMKMISMLSWEEIAKGLVGIAVGLGLLVGASLLMTAAIPGAGAMIIVAGALLIMSKAIVTIGKLSWEELIKGLIGIAAAITLMAIAGVLLTPAIPEILALGIALILLGAGIALVGVGAFLLAKAFGIIVDAAIALGKALPEVVKAIAEALPAIAKGLAEGIVEILKTFAEAAPIIAKALGTLLSHILDTLIEITPKIFEFLRILLQGFIDLVYEYTEPLIAAGFHVLISFLQGIRDNIEEITVLVTEIVVKFLEKMEEQVPIIVEALTALFIRIWLETAEALGEVSATILLGTGQAFIDGFLQGAEQQLSGPVAAWFVALPGKILGWFATAGTWLLQKGIDIITGLLNGINAGFTAVVNFFTGLPGQIIGFFAGAISWLAQAGTDTITGLFTAITTKFGEVATWLAGIPAAVVTAIKSVGGAALTWLVTIGENTMEGWWNGLKSVWNRIKGWLEGIVQTAIDIFKSALSLFSPSRVFRRIGEYTMLGFHLGMKDTWADAESWMRSLDPAAAFEDGMSKNFGQVVSSLAHQMEDMKEFNPTIMPILDLTKVQREAAKIGGYIHPGDLDPAFSRNQALGISRSYHSSREDGAEQKPNETKGVIFEQNIYAPEQLSTSEIYKQTRNQITIAKEELSIP